MFLSPRPLSDGHLFHMDAPANNRAAPSMWARKSVEPGLPPVGVVDVWRVDLDIPVSLAGDLWPLLDEQERARAASFHLPEHRQRFIAAHGALRCILAGSTGSSPDRIVLQSSERGKPRLHEAGLIEFNLTHSHSLALIALGTKSSLGVDVERIRPLEDAQSLARRFFSPSEVAQLAAAAGTSLESQSFFHCWTRKEAIIKGLGAGLSQPLDSFSVSVRPDKAAITEDLTPDGALQGWFLTDLQPGVGYAAALARAKSPADVRCWSWEW